MENQLHDAGERAGRPRRPRAHRRAGVPAKHVVTRFAALSDVPAGDLEMLACSLRNELDLGAVSPIPALHAAVRQEIRRRTDPAAG